MVCAAALEVQRIIKQEALVGRVKVMGDLLETKLKEAFEDHEYVGDVRGRGLFWAVSRVLLLKRLGLICAARIRTKQNVKRAL